MTDEKRHMKREKVPASDIAKVWHYFFADNAPAIAKDIAQKVKVGVAITQSRIFLSHDGGSHKPAEIAQLAEIGKLFAGTALRFGQVFGNDLTTFTLDSDEEALHIIPFRVEAVDEKMIDTVVVLFGKELAYMVFHFSTLAESGWKKVEPLLFKEK